MKIIVTGGAGFIGTNLIKFLLKKNINILNFDALKYSSNIKSLNIEKQNQYYQFVKGNICDDKKFLKLLKRFRPNGVINLAAESHVDRSIDNPAPFLKTNIFGTYSLLKASNTYLRHLNKREKKIFKFIHVSTDEVYGDLPLKSKPANELNAFCPSSPYAASKASSDHLVKAWGRTFNLPVIITNCSNNYGPKQHPEKLIPKLIYNILNNRNLPIYGKGINSREWIFVEDHCDALYKISRIGKIGNFYNIGSNRDVINIKISQNLLKIAKSKFKVGKNVKIKFVKDRPGHDIRYALNSKKIIKELKWYPKTNFKIGLLKTFNWYLDNLSYYTSFNKKDITKRLGLKK